MTDAVTNDGDMSGQADAVLPPVVIPTIAPEDADRVVAIGRATAAAAEALCTASSAAQALGLPDPDGLGVEGLDYSAIGEVGLSMLVWAGALLEGAHQASSRLIVVNQPRVHLP